MSKAGKRVTSGAGQGGPEKWEAALLAAQFEEVNPKILLFDAGYGNDYLPWLYTRQYNNNKVLFRVDTYHNIHKTQALQSFSNRLIKSITNNRGVLMCVSC